MLRNFVTVFKLRPIPRRHFSSALFISDRNTKTRPIITPRIDLAETFKNVEELDRNIKIRGLSLDAFGLNKLWKFYAEIKDMKDTLERRRAEITDAIKRAQKSGDKDAQEKISKLKLDGRLLREDLKELQKAFWDVEEDLMVPCLSLPNLLHPDTPLDEDRIIYDLGTANVSYEGKNHTARDDLLDIRDPHWYYLKGDAALFDISVMHYFSEGLENRDFQRMVPPDFCHSALIEACGYDEPSTLKLQPDKDNMHVLGGASLAAFCAFHAKGKVAAESMPVKHYSAGKRYQVNEGPGLFGVWQKSAVDIFVITSDSDKLKIELDSALESITEVYKSLGWNVRMVYVAAKSLKFWESLRVSFQMFSPSQDKWVEIGNVSVSDEFLSRRLLMEYEGNDKSGFCSVLSGTAIDITSTLACLIEQDCELFPDKLKPFI